MNWSGSKLFASDSEEGSQGNPPDRHFPWLCARSGSVISIPNQRAPHCLSQKTSWLCGVGPHTPHIQQQDMSLEPLFEQAQRISEWNEHCQLQHCRTTINEAGKSACFAGPSHCQLRLRQPAEHKLRLQGSFQRSGRSQLEQQQNQIHQRRPGETL